MKRALTLLAIFAVVGGLLVYRWTGLYVVVRNSTDSALTDVIVTFEGGEAACQRLGPIESLRRRIYPTAETDVVITFTDGEGRMHEEPADVCIKPGYHGTVRVEIGSANRVHITSDARPR